jgi:hypothetical protein
MTGIERGHITKRIPSDIWPTMKAGYETATGVLSSESHTFSTTNLSKTSFKPEAGQSTILSATFLSLRFASNLAAFLGRMPCTCWRAVPLREANTRRVRRSLQAATAKCISKVRPAAVARLTSASSENFPSFPCNRSLRRGRVIPNRPAAAFCVRFQD